MRTPGRKKSVPISATIVTIWSSVPRRSARRAPAAIETAPRSVSSVRITHVLAAAVETTCATNTRGTASRPDAVPATSENMNAPGSVVATQKRTPADAAARRYAAEIVRGRTGNAPSTSTSSADGKSASQVSAVTSAAASML
jgi:hypothetical protein